MHSAVLMTRTLPCVNPVSPVRREMGILSNSDRPPRREVGLNSRPKVLFRAKARG